MSEVFSLFSRFSHDPEYLNFLMSRGRDRNGASTGEDPNDINFADLRALQPVIPNRALSNVHEEDPDDRDMGPDVNPGEEANFSYVFRGHTDEVYSVACSPINTYLIATGGKDCKVFLWKFGSQDLKLELQGHEDTISTLAFSRDGKFLASGSFDGLIKIWDAKSGIIKCNLEASGGGVEWLKWHPSGHLLFAGSTDGGVRLWDADKRTHVRTFNGHTSGVTCGNFSRNGKIFCTGSNDASLRIWNTQTAESIDVRGRGYHTLGLTCLSINKRSTIVLTGSNDCTARTVDLSSGKVIRSLVSHSDSVMCCGFAHNCPYTFATGSMDSKLIVWNTLRSDPVCICEHKTEGRAEGVTCLLWLTVMRGIVTGTTYGKVRIWDYLLGTCLRTFDGHQGEIVSLAQTRKFSYIVSISRDCTARILLLY